MTQQQYIQEYNDTPPIGNILRKHYNDLSFRIHHLKNKQYPENEDDKKIILNLYNQLLTNFCTSNKILGLISFYDFDFNELNNTWINKLNLVFFKKFNINDVDDTPYYIKTYTFEITQDSPILENIILDIADEEFDGSLSLYCQSNNLSTILSPYPGGIDVIIKNKKLYNLAQSKIKSLGIKIQDY